MSSEIRNNNSIPLTMATQTGTVLLRVILVALAEVLLRHSFPGTAKAVEFSDARADRRRKRESRMVVLHYVKAGGGNKFSVALRPFG
jgi:hypothetical protein